MRSGSITNNEQEQSEIEVLADFSNTNAMGGKESATCAPFTVLFIVAVVV
jgi:hypothetical protein